MRVDIGRHESTIIWRGVCYFAPEQYPAISDWELGRLVCFCDYERANGRETELTCPDRALLARVEAALARPERYRRTPPPERIGSG